MDQIRFLLDAGWERLRIVTDHGWPLMPGGLPKTELHRSLTETRWGRCALLTDSAGGTDLALTWTWCAIEGAGAAAGRSAAGRGEGGAQASLCTPAGEVMPGPATPMAASVWKQPPRQSWRGQGCLLRCIRGKPRTSLR